MNAYQAVQFEKQMNRKELSLPSPLRSETENEQMALVMMKGRDTMKEKSWKFLKENKKLLKFLNRSKKNY